MEVIRADILGYCMGVRRAVDSACEALADKNGRKVYSLGPLIHNQTALDILEQKGLSIVNENEIKKLSAGDVVVVRAHGIPPVTMEMLGKKGCLVINATCPRVLASQKNAEKYARQDFTVILAGDKNHGEVVGIAGFAGEKFFLVENREDAQKLPEFKDSENAVLLCQTTFSKEEFSEISEVLSAKIKNLKIMNTICPATKQRQDALQKLCPEVEGIVVVGGKNSANTKRLFQIAKENCDLACLIENASEIPADFFALKKVGITAGASTPDNVIEDVVDSLLQKGL